MATTPGFLTDWPWKPLGSFKYVLLAPWVVHSLYYFVRSKESERDYTNFLIFPFVLSRMVHNQLWISYSRHRTAKGKSLIVDKPIDFEQVDRETNCYVFNVTGVASRLPAWRTDGVLIAMALHAGLVEFHSLHHTQFRTNYSLFMPFYDYIYGTMDKSSDTLYEISLEKEEEFPDVVHLTHLITPESVYYLRLGFSSWASVPQNQKWYTWLMWPMTIIINSICNQTFILERNILGKVKSQSWVIPKCKVQSEELNRNGEVYVQKYPKMKMRLVDGSSLAAAIVMNTIPKGTTEVLLRANLNKVSISIASALTQRGIKVVTSCEDDYEKLKLATNSKDNLVLSRSFTQKIWLVGEGLRKEEQKKAIKGTMFIPLSQFPPNKLRRDCFYHHPPAMLAPPSFQNLHSCENWLPRKAMSAARLAGILHALEGWNVHECGETMLDTDKVWEAAVRHGFRLMMLDFEWLRSFN
nr:Protein CER1-like 1 [Ipomoea batatas]